mmetsp:Transcript_17435/g.60880  ORF Transcript_17435/g.60880 Transcript_17435/m.60880 type:complete len:215 (-) Transcript_17435:2839-3483(-)
MQADHQSGGGLPSEHSHITFLLLGHAPDLPDPAARPPLRHSPEVHGDLLAAGSDHNALAARIFDELLITIREELLAIVVERLPAALRLKLERDECPVLVECRPGARGPIGRLALRLTGPHIWSRGAVGRHSAGALVAVRWHHGQKSDRHSLRVDAVGRRVRHAPSAPPAAHRRAAQAFFRCFTSSLDRFHHLLHHILEISNFFVFLQDLWVLLA